MSGDDIQDYFDEFKVKKIYWLNDYSCIIYYITKGVIEFDNEAIAISAFETLTESKEDPNLTDLQNFNWKKAKSFNVDEIPQEIYLRISDKNVFLLSLFIYLGLK